MKNTVYSKFSITAPQKRFILNTRYKPNTKSLFVYYNGALLLAGDDYLEVDEETVDLSFYAEPGDVVIISPLYTPTAGARNDDNPVIFDEFIIKTTKHEFTLRNNYIPNTNSVIVTRNGIAMSKSEYIEVDSKTIYIKEAPEVDDVIVITPITPVSNSIQVANSNTLGGEGNKSYDEFIIKTTDRVFNLSNITYKPNTNSILVYYNGLVLNPDKYIEIDSHTVTIKFEPELNDILVVAPVINNAISISNVNGDIVGSRQDSLFKRYGGEKRLMNNQLYSLEIMLNGKAHKYTFTSAYSPLFSSVKIIRSDLLEALQDIDDDTINFTIWQNSLLVMEIADAVTISIDAPITAAKNWVRYKTELDLLNTIYINIATNAGSIQKTLGNMQISKSVKIPYLDEMLKVIKRKLNGEESKLKSSFAGGTYMRKAGDQSYPITVERKSF